MCGALLSTVFLSFTTAQGPASAPKKLAVDGDVPGPVLTYLLNGKKKHSFYCPVTTHGPNPMVMVIVRGKDSLASFQKLVAALETKVKNNADLPLAACTILYVDELQELSDLKERTKTKGAGGAPNGNLTLSIKGDQFKEEIERNQEVQKLVNNSENVAIGLTSKQQVSRHFPDPGALATIILYDNLKVAQIYVLADGAAVEAKTPEILKDVAEKLGAKR